MLKILLFFQYKALYVFKTHFNCFNSQVNNLDDTERELFYGHKAIFFSKLKDLLLYSRRLNLCTKISIQ